jgi:3-(3-hydroxy-phenyl)propionate hydroxylase
MTYVNVVGRRRRWEIMLMPGDDPQAMMQPDALWATLSRWIRPGDATLVRHAIYTFHALIADRWRDRRVLLAGDSAHQTPPFLGQGMCAGVRDASNLAWKLDLVLRGADAGLLDSYQSERASHVLEYIRTAVRLGSIIQTTDPKVAAQRDRQFVEGGPQEIVNLAPPLGPGLHHGAGAAGTLPGQPQLQDGRWLDEALGNTFAIVCANRRFSDGLLPDEHARLGALGVAWLTDAALAPWLQQVGADAVVLRPDRYVFGIANSLHELRQLLARLPTVTSAMSPAEPCNILAQPGSGGTSNVFQP